MLVVLLVHTLHQLQTKSLFTIKTFLLCLIEFQEFAVAKHQIGWGLRGLCTDAQVRSLVHQKFIYNQDFSAIFDRIPGICCYSAPNWLRGSLTATQVCSLVQPKVYWKSRYFCYARYNSRNYMHLIGWEGHPKLLKGAHWSQPNVYLQSRLCSFAWYNLLKLPLYVSDWLRRLQMTP